MIVYLKSEISSLTDFITDFEADLSLKHEAARRGQKNGSRRAGFKERCGSKSGIKSVNDNELISLFKYTIMKRFVYCKLKI